MTAFQVKRPAVTGSNDPAHTISKNVWETPIPFSGELPVTNGGTGSTTATLARVAINQGEVTLTDAATINTDCSLGNVFTVTLGGNRTLANPTNMQAGASYAWIVTQGSGGSRTLTYGNAFTWPGGTVPTLSTAAGAVDMITAIYSGGKLRASCNLGFA